jgi:hypothetical protein
MVHQHHTADQVFFRALSGLSAKELVALCVIHLHRVFHPNERDSAERHLQMVIDEFKRRRIGMEEKISKIDRAYLGAELSRPSCLKPETSPDE